MKQFLENAYGAALILGMLAANPLLEKWASCWGTPLEIQNARLPGDNILPNPKLITTRSIVIETKQESIWPWLVQIGAGRGGFYSFDGLENLVGCDIHSADRILAEHQMLKRGDEIKFGRPANFPRMRVIEVEENRYLLLFSAIDPATGHDIPPDEVLANYAASTWLMYLDPIDDTTTRLVHRWRISYPPTLINAIAWRWLTNPITFVMERRMLRGIRERSEK